MYAARKMIIDPKEPDLIHFHEEYQKAYPKEKSHFQALELYFYEMALSSVFKII